jgi:uncharacterized protein
MKALKFLIYFILFYFVICFLGFYLQEEIFFHPKPLARDFKYTFEGNFEEMFFEPEKGVLINSLYFKADSSKGVVFYIHGNSDNLNRWGNYASDFLKEGYDVFMFDYRGFGKSKGEIAEAELHEDADFLYQKLLEIYPEEKIILYGRSLGSGMAAKIAASYRPKLLILETPYYNFIDLCGYYVPFLPCKRLLKFTFRTDIWIKLVECPVYFFHGTDDGLIPYNSSLKLTSLIKNENALISIEGGNHKNLNTFPLYHEKLRMILLR